MQAARARCFHQRISASSERGAEAATGWSLSEEELYCWLLYPKVFVDYAERRKRYGPVSALPTEVFFYGLPPGREVSVELDRGLTLVIRCLAIGETDDEGSVRVFYELNGQPRSVKVENREVAASVVRRPKADPSDPCHVAAPMPGVVASMAVAEGRTVAAGDLLMTIEAMKMETALHAERDGTVAAVHVSGGTVRGSEGPPARIREGLSENLDKIVSSVCRQ